MEVTGIILAGGKSSRMGKDKALMLLDNRPMISHVIETLRKITDNIIIIANSNEYKRFRYPVYADKIPNTGPIGGLYTGLLNATTSYSVVISCDTPYISEPLLNALVQEGKGADVCIPVKEHQMHPLIGVYSDTCIPIFKKAIDEENYKVRDAFEQLNIKMYDASAFNEAEFTNINTPEDLKIATHES